jgi:cell division septation protein DedD
LAHHTQDDGFHEIQLNGKQLVFLFMAVTVVSVVIFLCGVLVGRNVPSDRTSLSADASSAGTPVPDAAPSAEPTSPPAGADPKTAEPPPTVDDLSYYNRLEKANPPAEDLNSSSAPAAKKPATVKPEESAARTAKQAPARPEPAAAPAPAAKAEPAAPAASARAQQEPSGSGYAVQVAALNVQTEAEAIAKRLNAKGYQAYVVSPTNGVSVYRVRVGKFSTRQEAQAAATRLQKEEQFKPWITR